MIEGIRRFLTCLLFMLVGIILGTAVWSIAGTALNFPESLMGVFPLFENHPLDLNLQFLKLYIVMVFNLNFGSLLGAFIGFFLYTRR